MGFLLLMLLLITIVNVVEHLAKGKKQAVKRSGGNVIVEEVVRCCPPHRWRHVEVRDTEGNTVRWKLECELCGPLKSSDGPARAM